MPTSGIGPGSDQNVSVNVGIPYVVMSLLVFGKREENGQK